MIFLSICVLSISFYVYNPALKSNDDLLTQFNKLTENEIKKITLFRGSVFPYVGFDSNSDLSFYPVSRYHVIKKKDIREFLKSIKNFTPAFWGQHGDLGASVTIYIDPTGFLFSCTYLTSDNEHIYCHLYYYGKETTNGVLSAAKYPLLRSWIDINLVE